MHLNKGAKVSSSKLWFGKEKSLEPVGKAYSQRAIKSRPIHCAGESGSGWKFEVITQCDDTNLVGEIITIVSPINKAPYISSLYLPTLFTSGLHAGARIEATKLEYIYYLDFVLNTRYRLLNNWNEISLSEDSRNEIQDSIDKLKSAIQNRKTQPIIEAFESRADIKDSKGRNNPGAANAKFTAMASRLELQIGREDVSAGSMLKRRRFAAKILSNVEQNIWDMRNLHRLSPITVGRELNRRIENSKFKPMLFASLYIKNVYGNNLGDTSVLPKVIDCYTSEVQLMAIRNLIADIQRGENINESLRILKVLLSAKPAEDIYRDLFNHIINSVTAIEALLRNEDLEYKKICENTKRYIRYRANEELNHPWHIKPLAPK